ncbi:MAG: hypothetical protein K6V97_05570 [Actinomycetia bacterium]|nr:hypothetical protein [Actinomycetes bacterium]
MLNVSGRLVAVSLGLAALVGGPWVYAATTPAAAHGPVVTTPVNPSTAGDATGSASRTVTSNENPTAVGEPNGTANSPDLGPNVQSGANVQQGPDVNDGLPDRNTAVETDTASGPDLQQGPGSQEVQTSGGPDAEVSAAHEAD